MSEGVNGIAPLVQALPYQSIDEFGVIHLTGNRIGKGLVFAPSAGFTDDMRERLLQLLIKHLPDEVVLQVCLSASPYVVDALHAWKMAQQTHDVLMAQAQKRSAHFSAALETPWPGFGASCRRFQGWLGLSCPAGKDAFFTLQRTIDAFSRELGTMHIATEPLSIHGLLAMLRANLNATPATQSLNTDWRETEALKQQLVEPKTLWQQTKESLVATHRDWQVTPLIASTLPREFEGSQWLELCGQLFNEAQQLSSPFEVHVMAVKHKQANDASRTTLGFKRAEKAMRFTWLTKLNPNLRAAMDDWRYTNTAIQTGNDALVEVMVSARVGSLQAEHQAALSRFQAVGAACGFEWQTATQLSLPLWLSQCPFAMSGDTLTAWEKQGRFKTMTASALTEVLPLSAPTSTPLNGMLLVGRRGELFGFDNFNPQHRNFNVAVTGTSGSGKSVYIQELIARNLSQPNRRVFVLDIGRSYETACHVFGGQYLDFNQSAPVSLNPFSQLTQDDWVESKSQLVAMVMAMVGLNPQHQVDSVSTFISQSLSHVWQQHQHHLTFTRIMTHWQSHPDVRMHELALRLQPFTTQGDYAAWFEPPCSVDLNNPLVVLELEHLKPHPRLLPVVVMMLMANITQTMYRGANRGEKVMCVIDEAWDLFKDESFASFIEEGYRRARKYNGSFVAGTQSLMDFAISNATRALIKNADTLISLSQDANDYALAVDAKLIATPTPFERHLISSLKTRKGKYAECLIQSKNGNSQLGRLVLEPFSSALYATDAERFNHIRALVKKGSSWTEAVMQLAGDTHA